MKPLIYNINDLYSDSSPISKPEIDINKLQDLLEKTYSAGYEDGRSHSSTITTYSPGPGIQSIPTNDQHNIALLSTREV